MSHIPNSAIGKGLRRSGYVPHAKADRQSAISGGFTLIEILLAMFILALGMIAIASVFPVAGYLQKQHYDKTITEDVKLNVELMVRKTNPDEKFWHDDPPPVPTDDLEISYAAAVPPPTDHVFQLFLTLLDDNPATPPPDLVNSILWPLSMRCSPQVRDIYTPDPIPPLPPIRIPNGIPNEPENDTLPRIQWADDGEDPLFFRREFYWVPLARDKNGGGPPRDWEMYIFVVRANPDADYDYTGSGYPDTNNWRRRSAAAAVVFANRNDGRENPIDNGAAATAATRWHVPGVRRFALHATPIQAVSNPIGAVYPSNSTRLRINQAGVGNITSGGNLTIGRVVQIGDLILGNNGRIYHVVDVDNPDGRFLIIDHQLQSAADLAALRAELTAIWLALPAVIDQPSPATQIFSIDP